ncbi:MAG: hypothetical protein KAR38_03190, partial [Calditrichia bacterium]|nr:hypothetical protein [Calditrichia bacterium]
DVIVEESIDNFNGIIKLEAIEDFPADSKIKIALIEKYTHLLSPGTNGVQDYTNVMRKMYPDAGGSTISLSAGETTTIHFEFEIRSDWINQVQVVAFIQIGDSGEIIQAVQSLIY